MATGDKSAHTPWQTIGQEASKFMDLDCIPTGFFLQDPSRMGKTVKDLIKHLRERQEHLGVNAFHFTSILGNHEEIEPSKYPLEAQKVISSGGGSTSPPGDTPKSVSASMGLKGFKKSGLPVTAPTDMTGSGPKSPDRENQSAEDMGGQLISALSSKILEGGPTNVMNKAPVQNPNICLPRSEDHNLGFFNVSKVESFSLASQTYNATEVPQNYLLVPHPSLPPIPMIPAPPAITPVGLCHYPQSVWPESHITQKAEIGPQVSFSPTRYPSNHELANIDPRLLPSGPIPFLYPNPMFEPPVQPGDPFRIRTTARHPQNPSELANKNVDQDSSAAVEGHSRADRAVMPLPGESSLKISIATPKGTPVKHSPEKRNQGKMKQNQDQEEPSMI
jgi:hypothetical protein